MGIFSEPPRVHQKGQALTWDWVLLKSEQTRGRRFLRVANLNRRSKLSHDPNNTVWSRSATKYGQKILKSHGWTPGELLGASGAKYSDLRSAASASHIRITLKDDNLGLGAKLGAARDNSQTTGLDVYQDLLGRLNGRNTTDLEKDRMHRSNLRSSAYINQRWGNIRFVRGGLLVGTELRGLMKGEQDALNNSGQTPSHFSENGTLPEANRPQEVRSQTSKRKKHKKRKSLVDDHGMKETSNGVDWSIVGAHPPRKPQAEPELETHTSPKAIFDQIQTEKVRRHAEKAERKLKRRLKRDARHSMRVQEQPSVLPSPQLIRPPDSDVVGVAVASPSPREANISTKFSQGLGAGRLTVRHRNIQHKNMCMLDSKALNEVCMSWPVWWYSKWLTTRRY